MLTKSDSSWELPVTWVGTSGHQIAKILLERDDLYYQKNIAQIWTSEELFDKVGVVEFKEPSIPSSKKTSGSKEDTLDGFVVTRKTTWIDDPDYSEPTEEERLDVNRNHVISNVKTEAQLRILAIAPEWKQRNFAFLHQQVTDGTVKTTAEADGATDEQKEVYEKQKTEWADQEAMWGKINVIRLKSSDLETSVLSMDKETLNKYIVSEDSNWE